MMEIEKGRKNDRVRLEERKSECGIGGKMDRGRVRGRAPNLGSFFKNFLETLF